MTNKRTISNDSVQGFAAVLVQRFIEHNGGHAPMFPTVYGVPRGGLPVAYAFAQQYAQEVKGARPLVVDDPLDADVLLDDIVDSGKTMRELAARVQPRKNQHLPFFGALFGRDAYLPVSVAGRFGTVVHAAHVTPAWIVFPWESNELASAEDAPIRLLQFIGEDPTRGGLHETPKRFLKAWQHYTSGYNADIPALLKVFEDGAEKADEMVCVHDIPVYSHCEHHLAPFFGVAHVAYIPTGKIVGLSKLARVVDAFSRRLQVQERLTNQIADAIDEHLQPLGVGVVLTCRHFCMEARGVQRQGTSTTTSAMRGAFRSQDSTRAEFLSLVRSRA